MVAEEVLFHQVVLGVLVEEVDQLQQVEEGPQLQVLEVLEEHQELVEAQEVHSLEQVLGFVHFPNYLTPMNHSQSCPSFHYADLD